MKGGGLPVSFVASVAQMSCKLSMNSSMITATFSTSEEEARNWLDDSAIVNEFMLLNEYEHSKKVDRRR